MARDVAAIHRWLRGLALLEGVDDRHLRWLARHSWWHSVGKGQTVFARGNEADAFAFLVEGRADLLYDPDAPPGTAITRSQPGHPVGWPALAFPPRHRWTTVADTPLRLLLVDRRRLEQRLRRHRDLAVQLARRLVDVAAADLRAVRAHTVMRRFDTEVEAIRALIEHERATLPVTSPLHRIPTLVADRLTLGDAFRTIEHVERSGTPPERQLAALLNDLLAQVRREMLVHRRLTRIFESVARAPADASAAQIREGSATAFLELFNELDVIVRGESLLPDERAGGPGHIVVLNHLTIHRDNRLPNGMLLALDTHFVASVLLYVRYGRPPVRVVRAARPTEAGQRQYYGRQGFVVVGPGDASLLGLETASREDSRWAFYRQAAEVLHSGEHLVVAPEGETAPTERSPGLIRPGAFYLGGTLDPEPLVVPIAVANFDKQITRVRPVAVVHEPIRVTDHVPDPRNREALLDWINGPFHAQYRRWVREAAALSAHAGDTPDGGDPPGRLMRRAVS